MLLRLRGLRGRLALGCLLLLAFGLAAADVTAYFVLKRQIEMRDVSIVEVSIARTLAFSQRPDENWTVERVNQVIPDSIYIGIYSPDGTQLLERYPPSLSVESSPEVPSAAELEPGLTTLRAPNASDGLIVGGLTIAPEQQVDITVNGKPARLGGVVVGLTDKAELALLRQQAIIQVVTAILILLLAGGAIALILRFGLAPLRQVANTAQEISGGDSSRRIPVDDERTEIGAVSQSLNDAFDHVEESEQRMRSFVADASHELRTPLTTIHGWADLYLNDGIGEWADVDVAMTRIRFETARMTDLVEQLLVLARQDASADIRRESVDLVALCADIVASAAATYPTHPITTSGGSSVRVEGDETLLRQMVSNLVLNAARHTPDGTQVHIDVERELDSSSVRVVVSDEGPGLDLEQLELAFDRFWRANSGRGPTGGTGLGLSIVRSIALAHGGTATLDSPPGSGLRVTVRLPAEVEAGA